MRRPDRGIWQLSGYVLSRAGARKLLAMLPAGGPIDLWLNLKFDQLDVRMTSRPLIDQRPSLGSSNAYSILPVLSQLGVLDRERPAIFAARDLPRPVVAYGGPGSGLTSVALASTARFRYGRFAAELRPSKASGLVTGIFLHRNGPRQEIDIELLGKDPTRLLVNVFFNPGGPGTKLEYGYRGTPAVVDLGFDASEDFHVYEIDWQLDAITWIVDGAVVHKRAIWQPTPIPDQPMEFNINLWHSRSTELAGKLEVVKPPAQTIVRRVSVDIAQGSAERRPGVRSSRSTDPMG